jgi:hypothetical protein
MTRQNTAHADDDDDAFDENGILRDGARWRVPMRMMDSFQRDVAKHFSQPGFTRGPTTVRDTRNTLYDEYDSQISSLWKNPPTGAGSHGQRGPQVGTICTVKGGGGDLGPEGAPGHWTRAGDELICIADDRVTDRNTADHAAVMDQRYAAYDADLANAWRRAR